MVLSPEFQMLIAKSIHGLLELTEISSVEKLLGR